MPINVKISMSNPERLHDTDQSRDLGGMIGRTRRGHAIVFVLLILSLKCKLIPVYVPYNLLLISAVVHTFIIQCLHSQNCTFDMPSLGLPFLLHYGKGLKFLLYFEIAYTWCI